MIKKYAVFIFIAAILLRIIFLGVFFQKFSSHYDEEYYDDLAKNLAKGHGYVLQQGEPPNLWRAPLYPFLLVPFYLISDNPFYYIVLVHFLFDVAAAVFLFLIGKKVYNSTVGVLAGSLLLMYPFSLYYTAHILSESFFTFLLVIFVYFVFLSIFKAKTIYFLLSGIFCGFVTLCRPSTLFLPFFSLVVMVMFYRNIFLCSIKKLFFFLFAFVLVLFPWSYRNYRVTGHFIPVTTGGGYNLWLGNNIATDGKDFDQLSGEELVLLEKMISQVTKEDSLQFDYHHDRTFARLAITQALENPVETGLLLGKKLYRFWFSVYHPSNQWIQPFVIIIHSFILFFSIFGIIFSLKMNTAMAPVLALIVYFVLIHTAIISTVRYAIPIIPLFLLFTAYAINKVLNLSSKLE